MSDEATQPRIEWQGTKLYLHAADGGVWRVYDCQFANFRSHPVPHGDPRAVHREFVAPDGTHRVCRFERSTSRAFTADVLQEQLRGAGYAARERFVPPTDAPGRAGGGMHRIDGE